MKVEQTNLVTTFFYVLLLVLVLLLGPMLLAIGIVGLVKLEISQTKQYLYLITEQAVQWSKSYQSQWDSISGNFRFNGGDMSPTTLYLSPDLSLEQAQDIYFILGYSPTETYLETTIQYEKTDTVEVHEDNEENTAVEEAILSRFESNKEIIEAKVSPKRYKVESVSMNDEEKDRFQYSDECTSQGGIMCIRNSRCDYIYQLDDIWFSYNSDTKKTASKRSYSLVDTDDVTVISYPTHCNYMIIPRPVSVELSHAMGVYSHSYPLGMQQAEDALVECFNDSLAPIYMGDSYYKQLEKGCLLTACGGIFSMILVAMIVKLVARLQRVKKE